MNPQIAYTRPNAEIERATLGDLLRAVEKLRLVWLAGSTRQVEKAADDIAHLAADLEHMEGLVLDGEVYDVTPAGLRAARHG